MLLIRPTVVHETLSARIAVNNRTAMKKHLTSIFLLISATTFGQQTASGTSPNVFIAVLRDGLDNVKATVNDSTMFIATKGQLILYWDHPHTALIADGRFGYIPPEQLKRIDTSYFKFNFSKLQFVYDKDYELYQCAQRTGVNLNSLVKQIQGKDNNALLQYFNLRHGVDGASAEEFYKVFWQLINLWSDAQLSTFIMQLNGTERKDFCNLLIDSSYCDPYRYYKLYYPLTLKKITATK
jgi:hypothetical protein